MPKFKGFDPELKSWDFPMIINGWVHKLSGSEFKILWYILRHTYGWQKDSDAISYRQFRLGIKKKNGEWLDRGTGMGFGAIKKAIDGLVEKGFIEVEKSKDEKGHQAVNSYKPRLLKQKSGNPRLLLSDSAHPNRQSVATIFNNEQSLNTPSIVSPKYSSLKDIKETDLMEISERYRIPLSFVKLQLEKMTNWLEAKGKKYKNYKRGLMNWVLSEAQKKIETQQQKKGGFVDADQI